MRERPPDCIVKNGIVRITPACAGKTRVRFVKCSLRKDHPRVCGKDWRQKIKSDIYKGSPPRVRERLQEVLLKAGYDGITPACAGKTPLDPQQHPLHGDHPRVCGKDSVVFKLVHVHFGSPPRVRERHPHACFHLLKHRITPACAGKTMVKNHM